MIIINDKKNCMGCTACYSVCPTNAIEMKEDNEGFVYPIVDDSLCVNCHLCEKKCPIQDKDNIQINILDSYLMKNRSIDVLHKSSSGGVFFELGRYILKNNGIVFGAYYDNDKREVYHKMVDNFIELEDLCKSKYMQSELNDIFKLIKVKLNKKKLVLFVGTPCQVQGLLYYLGKKYYNLITVDFVCHGVPSKYVWQKYLNSIEFKYKEKVKNIKFRYKNNEKWTNCSIKIELENKNIKEALIENSYLYNFNNSLFLRPSCYDCKFKKYHRNSDITLADAWGIQVYDQQFFDENGVSYVLINSQKGKEIIESIKIFFIYKSVEFDYLTKYNAQYQNNASMNNNRSQFFYSLNKYGYEEAIKKYGDNYSKSLIKKIKYIMKLLFKHNLKV